MRATVKLVLRKDYTKQDGKQQLALRYVVHQKSTHIGLGISILPRQWNKNALMVRSGEPLAYQYNKVIQQIHQRALTLVMDNYNNPLPIPKFRELLFEKTDSHTDFYDFITQELEYLKTDRREGTIANYNKLINTMKLWKPSLAFSEITLDFIEKFHAHEIEQGNLESTVYKKHANFKFLIGRAILKGKMENNPYASFPLKKNIKTQNDSVLSESQLNKLYEVFENGNYTNSKKEVLRDFLFSAYTGLSYADIREVTYSQLKKYTINGHEYFLLIGTRAKTGEIYKIPIVSPKAQRLLGSGLDFQKIFSPLSNDKSNDYIEKILKEVGFKEKITFHRLRHSFGTIAARKGMRREIIKLIMGHSSNGDITDVYTHLRDEDIIAEMLGKWVA